MSSAEDGHDEDASEAQPHAGTEPLACVSCRARKLKCDRTKPACARCTKVNSECVYPESRRKPTFKRRNVRELEARLAQVETLLKGVNETANETPVEHRPPRVSVEPEDEAFAFPSHGTARTASEDLSPHDQIPYTQPGLGQPISSTGIDTEDWQLMGLGLSEALPPWEVIEALTDNYFNVNYHFVPIVHPGRYRQAMYGGPYMQPPMCLQYILWATSAHNHDKYNAYSDVFYKRARLYFEKDEMKGDGEHFVTIPHAQALVLIASYEAKRMLFTRAAMNTAKCVRLINMMGLEKMDGDQRMKMAPSIQPARSWIEKEERRRTFWGAFAIDAHASVSTGWPSLISSSDVSTRLPSSEDAFVSGREENAPFLEEVSDGAEYSSFASTIVSCNVFKSILKHVHRPRPNDRPEDVFQGAFWERHREFDNMLLSLLMFLPASLKLHSGQKDAAAIYLNLNLHASVICLHHAAIEQAEKHDLTASIKQSSLARLRSSATEIANIAKAAAHMTQSFKSPLCSLSLYTATTVYVFLAKQDPVSGLGPIDRSNLELILRLMEAIGRFHQITHAFLQQAWNDLERNGLSHVVRATGYQKHSRAFTNDDLSSIPLITRTGNIHQQDRSALLPGRLPLGKPVGYKVAARKMVSHQELRQASGTFEKMATLLEGECFQTVLGAVTRNIDTMDGPPPPGITHKRKRMSPSPGPDWNPDLTAHIPMIPPQPGSFIPGTIPQDPAFTLPDRTTGPSSSSSSPAYRSSNTTATTDTQRSSGSSHTSPGMLGGLGNTAEENRIDLRQFQGREPSAAQLWDPFFFGEVTDEMVNEALGQASGEPWSFLTADMQWPGPGG